MLKRRRVLLSEPGFSPLPKVRRPRTTAVDVDGNAVAVTYTLNGGFGNGITVPGSGSSSITRWTTSRRNQGSRTCSDSSRERPTRLSREAPLSSMAPTIVLKRRSAAHVARRAWWLTHSHRGAPGLPGSRRLRDDPAGGGGRAADASSVAAGSDLGPARDSPPTRSRSCALVGMRSARIPGRRSGRGTDRQGQGLADGCPGCATLLPRLGLLKHRRHVRRLVLVVHSLRRDPFRSGRQRWRRPHVKKHSMEWEISKSSSARGGRKESPAPWVSVTASILTAGRMSGRRSSWRRAAWPCTRSICVAAEIGGRAVLCRKRRGLCQRRGRGREDREITGSRPSAFPPWP